MFHLAVRNTGLSFFTGDVSHNADGTCSRLGDSTLDQTGACIAIIGFEDLLGGGDLDYNDFEFRLINGVDPSISLPSVLALLAPPRKTPTKAN